MNCIGRGSRNQVRLNDVWRVTQRREEGCLKASACEMKKLAWIYQSGKACLPLQHELLSRKWDYVSSRNLRCLENIFLLSFTLHSTFYFTDIGPSQPFLPHLRNPRAEAATGPVLEIASTQSRPDHIRTCRQPCRACGKCLGDLFCGGRRRGIEGRAPLDHHRRYGAPLRTAAGRLLISANRTEPQTEWGVDLGIVQVEFSCGIWSREWERRASSIHDLIAIIDRTPRELEERPKLKTTLVRP